jgi:small subunit ribosomal protein S8
MVDPITDLLNRIRNAAMAQHVTTKIPYSNVKARVVEILKNEGFIDDFSENQGDGVHRDIVVNLRYINDSRTAINKLRRVSKPGRRVYCRVDDIKDVMSGLGVAIISTSKGIMTDRDARRQNVGGEVLCEIW